MAQGRCRSRQESRREEGLAWSRVAPAGVRLGRVWRLSKSSGRVVGGPGGQPGFLEVKLAPAVSGVLGKSLRRSGGPGGAAVCQARSWAREARRLSEHRCGESAGPSGRALAPWRRLFQAQNRQPVLSRPPRSAARSAPLRRGPRRQLRLPVTRRPGGPVPLPASLSLWFTASVLPAPVRSEGTDRPHE